MLQASGQILQAALLPVLGLGSAVIGLFETDTAMWIAKWILVGELGVDRAAGGAPHAAALVAADADGRCLVGVGCWSSASRSSRTDDRRAKLLASRSRDRIRQRDPETTHCAARSRAADGGPLRPR